MDRVGGGSSAMAILLGYIPGGNVTSETRIGKNGGGTVGEENSRT